MEMSIKEKDLKVFVKVAKFLARTSPEIYMIMRSDSMSFKVIDQSETTITCATFNRSFFNIFNFTKMNPEENVEDLDDNTNVVLFPAKFFLLATKAWIYVKEFTIKFDNNENPEKMLLDLEFKNGAVFNHQMILLDITSPFTCSMPPVQSFETNIKEICIHPSKIDKYLNNLVKEAFDFVLTFEKDCFTIKNYNVDDDHEDMMRFNIKIEKSQFVHYDVDTNESSSVVVQCSSFIHMINFASTLNDSEISIHSYGSQLPIILKVEKVPSLTVESIQASLKPEGRLLKKKRQQKKTLNLTKTKNDTIVNVNEILEEGNQLENNRDLEAMEVENEFEISTNSVNMNEISEAGNQLENIRDLEPIEDENDLESSRNISQSFKTNKFKFKTPSDQHANKRKSLENVREECSLTQEKRRKTFLPEVPSFTSFSHKNDISRQDFSTLVDLSSENFIQNCSQADTSHSLPNSESFINNIPAIITSTQETLENKRLKKLPIKVSEQIFYGVPICEGSDED